MTSVYYAKTTYHIILCSCIAYERKREHSYLVISPGFRGWESILQALREVGHPFKSIIQIKPDIGCPPPHKRYYDKFLNIIKSVAIIKKVKPDNVWICKDGSPVSKALMYWSNNNCQYTYVEDGAAAYNSVVTTKPARWREYIESLIYGPWYSSVKIHGESSDISRIAATFPNHIRPELQHLEKYRVKPNYIQHVGVQWAKECITDVLELPHPIQNIETVFFMEKYRDDGKFPNNHKQKTLSLINNRISKGRTVGVKYHPAEEIYDYLDVKDKEKVILIPQAIPSELVCYISDRLDEVIGLSTTSLLSSQWMLQDVSAISTARQLKYKDERFINVMDDIGVQFA